MKKKYVFAVAGVVALLATGTWWWGHREQPREALILYGNVDLRQVDLAFNSGERISEVLVQEGDRVRPGQVLARLDTSRLQPQVAQAEAQVATQQEVVRRMHDGSRAEELAQARANVALAKAEATDSQSQYSRVRALFETSSGRAISEQDLDQARATADMASAKLTVSKRALDLAVAGPRVEEVRQADAELASSMANAALVRQQLVDAELISPIDGVVRSRILEPGELAAPQRPVLSLANVDPKWVRAYVAESDLPALRSGMAAEITVDGFPARGFLGWVGFMSPSAEFTPKAVQTDELRSSLVYEVRVFVKDPGDILRLGMPATVRIGLTTPAAGIAASARQNR